MASNSMASTERTPTTSVGDEGSRPRDPHRDPYRDPPVRCTLCGGRAGKVKPGCRLPIRYHGWRFGLPGKICHECVVASPERVAIAFRRQGSAAGPSREEVRREALAILSELAARGDEIEVRRVAEFRRGPAWREGVSAREAAAWAVEEFDATWIGGLLS